MHIYAYIYEEGYAKYILTYLVHFLVNLTQSRDTWEEIHSTEELSPTAVLSCVRKQAEHGEQASWHHSSMASALVLVPSFLL